MQDIVYARSSEAGDSRDESRWQVVKVQEAAVGTAEAVKRED